MSSAQDFDGAVVIVTGGSSGLGRAIAEEVARRGAKAVAMSFVGDPRDGDEAADAVRKLGAEAIPMVADVADEADCRRTVEAVARHGKVDALFNNAGTTVFVRWSTPPPSRRSAAWAARSPMPHPRAR
jgi:NAD(P)-dependent dehydrogenase (short-subunit alcohol dehydrogenase family)